LKTILNFKIIAILILVFHGSIFAYDPNETILRENKLPKELEGIGAKDSLGRQLDTSLVFQDSSGEMISIQQILASGLPTILSPVYFKCPTLCNYHMNGVMNVLKKTDWDLGKKYQYVAVSIDPKENPSISSDKKKAYLQDYNRKVDPSSFRLLTGTQESIQALTKDLDFNYKWDSESKQYIHASLVYILTPEGRVSRVLQGISFDSRDLKLSLLEASKGKIGDFIDRFALFCFQFDPTKNKYTLYAYNIMRLGALFTFGLVACFLLIFWIQYNKNLKQGVA
jgi:protein SCO1/2